jgi:hypothetical protein
MCATNQQGIDIVLPVCHVTQNLGPDSDGHNHPGEKCKGLQGDTPSGLI